MTSTIARRTDVAVALAERKAPQLGLETITPELAQRWLGRNTHNRNIAPSRVNRYAGAMRRGEWRPNTDAIGFDRNGRLLNGQHRLLAVVESGVSIESFVASNLDPEAQDTMDIGLTRSPASILTLHGYVDTTTLAAAIGYLHRIERRMIRATGQAYVPPTPDEMLALIQRYPRIHESIKVANRLNKRLRVPRAQMAALHCWLSEIDSQDADDFFDALTTGLNLADGNPVYALRSWMEKTKAESKRVNRYIIHGVVVRAWNAFRDGSEMKIARFRPALDALPEPR